MSTGQYTHELLKELSLVSPSKRPREALAEVVLLRRDTDEALPAQKLRRFYDNAVVRIR